MKAEPARLRWSWIVPLTAIVLVMMTILSDPKPLRLLRNATFDQYQRWSPRLQTGLPVRIVDIDDESLRRLGQWPWPRSRVAELIDDLQRARPASIALDIVIAEPDRTSPQTLLQGPAVPPETARYLKSLPDHDELLAAALARSNAAIGFALTNGAPDDGASVESAAMPISKARFITVGGSPLPHLPAFSSSVRSLVALQQAAAGHGALTFVPDDDGVVRQVPLLANADGHIVPSLSAEALRLSQGVSNYTVHAAPEGGGLTDVRVGRLNIPTDAHGALWVHYGSPSESRYLPAWKVLAGLVPTSELENRIVLLGTSAQGLMDLRFNPLGGIIPGVEIHAQALEQVLSDHQLSRPGWAPAAELVIGGVAGLVVGGVAMLCGALASVASLLAVAGLLCVGAWHAFRHFDLLFDPSTLTLGLCAIFVPTTVVRHLLTERRQRWVRQAFARYVSPNLVDYLIAHPGALELGGKRQRCSFVFADVAGFTSMMETMEPAVAVSILNAYLDKMISVAFEHEGTLDRIVGDSVAIVFSAPVEQSDHEARALRCALAMQRFAHGFVAELATRNIHFGETRIGVHTGEVTVGNFGGSTIFDYRALGDPVNIASRLEGANKHLGTSICVSEATLAGCLNAPARPIGRLQLVGRLQPVMAFEPLDADSAHLAPDHAYLAAYKLMAEQKPEAITAFESMRSSRPHDGLVALHWQRLCAGVAGDLIELQGK